MNIIQHNNRSNYQDHLPIHIIICSSSITYCKLPLQQTPPPLPNPAIPKIQPYQRKQPINQQPLHQTKPAQFPRSRPHTIREELKSASQPASLQFRKLEIKTNPTLETALRRAKGEEENGPYRTWIHIHTYPFTIPLLSIQPNRT